MLHSYFEKLIQDKRGSWDLGQDHGSDQERGVRGLSESDNSGGAENRSSDTYLTHFEYLR
jgi:hypothetical protein